MAIVVNLVAVSLAHGQQIPVPPPRPYAHPSKVPGAPVPPPGSAVSPVPTPPPVPPPRPPELQPELSPPAPNPSSAPPAARPKGAPAPAEAAPKQPQPTPPKAEVPPADPVAACLAKLDALDIQAERAAPHGTRSDPLCAVAVPVRLVSMGRKAGQPVMLSGSVEVDCTEAETFGRFVEEVAVPLAKGVLGTPLTAVVAGGYQCRTMNSMPSGHISPHATGIALDIMQLGFGDGRRIDIGQPTDAAMTAYLKGFRTASCGYFNTVLGPGANTAHANHFHIDVMRHGTDGHYRICE